VKKEEGEGSKSLQGDRLRVDLFSEALEVQRLSELAKNVKKQKSDSGKEVKAAKAKKNEDGSKVVDQGTVKVDISATTKVCRHTKLFYKAATYNFFIFS
jgi:hypothetical protein